MVAGLVAAPACGLFKKGDLVDAKSLAAKFAQLPELDSTNLVRDNSQVIKLRMIDLFPGIQAYGGGTPPYVGSAGAYVDLFNDEDWEPSEATGIAAAFNAESRPTDPVSQNYWKNRIYPACDWHLGSTPAPDSAPAGAIFSKADVLLEGEKLPDAKTDPATYWAFLASRNAFLYPYAVDSPEVSALAGLYKVTLGDSDVNTAAWKDSKGAFLANRSPAELARMAVCVAALTAPQFMLGNSSKVDVIRKLAYTLGYRRPTFREISDFVGGKLELAGWIAKLQETEGYFAAVGRWHRDWLGMRPFHRDWTYFYPEGRTFPANGNGWGSQVQDARINYGNNGVGQIQRGTFSWFTHDYAFAYPQHFTVGLGTAPPDVPKIAISLATNPVETMRPLTTESGSYLDSLQDFDPRTAIVSYEFGACPAAGQFPLESTFAPKVLFVLKSAYDTQLAALQKTVPGFPFDATHCKLANPASSAAGHAPNAATEADYTAGGLFPSYYYCKSDDSAVYTDNPVSLGLNGNFYGNVEASVMYDRGSIAIVYGCNGYNLGAYNSSPFGNAKNRPVFRIRRFSPALTGAGAFTDQNGLSLAATWFAGEQVLTSNTLQRFLLTCSFRPGPEFAGKKPTWYHAADYYAHYLGDFVIPTARQSRDFNLLSNPYFLNQFRCGKPSLPALDATTLTTAVNDAAYPFAYDHSLAGIRGGSVPQNTLNGVINTGGLAWSAAFTSNANPRIPAGSPSDADPHTGKARYNAHTHSNGDEAGALLRLQSQIESEPLNLVRHILKNHLSYGEMLTARYTIGGPELELYYRTQGYFLPGYPDAGSVDAVHAAATETDPTQYHRIDLAGFTGLRANYLHPAVQSTASGAMPQNPATGAVYYMFATDAPQYAFSQNAAIPPRAGAGVLTMPAFLSPVTVQDVKLRSVAHRIYQRFLCGEPNVVTLSQGEQATHYKYLQSPNNPADIQHLNSSTSCYQCHINMDPLASALGFNFLDTVLTPKETAGSMGELYAPSEILNQYLFGVRAGPFRGSGAFLGKEIRPDSNNSGFQQVGQILAADGRFGMCLASKAFQKLFGRGPSVSEVPYIKTASKHFMADGLDFDRLIQDLAVSAAYDKDN